MAGKKAEMKVSELLCMGWIESTKWVNARNGKPGNTLRKDEGSTNDEKSLVR